MKIDHKEDYAQRRSKEYPAMADQLDALWHAMDAGALPKIEPMYSQIKAVKDQIKKPGIE
jgi:hypothetical protein